MWMCNSSLLSESAVVWRRLQTSVSVCLSWPSSPFVVELTFLNHPNDSDAGLASARHFNVTFSRSARIIIRAGTGSSLAKCTDTIGASVLYTQHRKNRRKRERKRKWENWYSSDESKPISVVTKSIVWILYCESTESFATRTRSNEHIHFSSGQHDDWVVHTARLWIEAYDAPRTTNKIIKS